MWMSFWILFWQVAIPFGVVALTLFVVSRSELGRALIDRLRGSGPDPAALDDLSDEVARLSERLLELEERFDFTERILVERPPPERLPSSADSDERVGTPG